MTQTRIIRWQDVDAYLQSKLSPKHRGKRVRRHKLLYACWRAGILRTGTAPFEATFIRAEMGPYCTELAGATYDSEGNPQNLDEKQKQDCDEVIAALGDAMSPELKARS